MKSRFDLALNAAFKAFTVVNPFSNVLLVNEYPKSGGTWLCRALSEATQYQFVQLFRRPVLSSCIVHTHRFWLETISVPPVFSLYLVRNPFDVYI